MVFDGKLSRYRLRVLGACAALILGASSAAHQSGARAGLSGPATHSLSMAGPSMQAGGAPDCTTYADGHVHCGSERHQFEDSVVRKPGEEEALIAKVESQGIGKRGSAPMAGRVAALAASTDPGLVGQWSAVIDWPVLGIHMSLLSSGKVLVFDSLNDGSTVWDNTRALVFDPATMTSVRNDFLGAYNLFCAGLAKLFDGTLLVAGGTKNAANDGINKTTTFDSTSSSWTVGAPMSVDRWYPSVTPMPNGEALITGGGPDLSEVRTPAGSLRPLTNARQSLWANRIYPFFTTAPNGKAQYLGPYDTLAQVDVSGAGAYTYQGTRDGKIRDYGSFVHYTPGKVLLSGGGVFDGSAVVVDLNSATTSATGSMAFQRRQHNLTALADGTVLATGGYGNSSELLVDLANATYNAEVWNPSTGVWTTLAPADRARQYHSSALLLPDGRVLTAGGGLCNTCEVVGYYQRNAEVFSPPYLFRKDGSGQLAPRPVISSTPTQLGYGRRFGIATPNPARIDKVGLVRLGSVTHSIDMEQRYVPLSFTRTASGIVNRSTVERERSASR